jgi:hypothetical protein
MEIIIDFSSAVGDVIMKNNAKKPFPDGDPVDSNLDGQVMMFNVTVNPANTIDNSLTKNYKMENTYPSFS